MQHQCPQDRSLRARRRRYSIVLRLPERRSGIALRLFQPLGGDLCGAYLQFLSSSSLLTLCSLPIRLRSRMETDSRCNHQVGCQGPRDPNDGRWRSNCGVAGDSGTHFGPTAPSRFRFTHREATDCGAAWRDHVHEASLDRNRFQRGTYISLDAADLLSAQRLISVSGTHEKRKGRSETNGCSREAENPVRDHQFGGSNCFGRSSVGGARGPGLHHACDGM